MKKWSNNCSKRWLTHEIPPPKYHNLEIFRKGMSLNFNISILNTQIVISVTHILPFPSTRLSAFVPSVSWQWLSHRDREELQSRDWERQRDYIVGFSYLVINSHWFGSALIPVSPLSTSGLHPTNWLPAWLQDMEALSLSPKWADFASVSIISNDSMSVITVKHSTTAASLLCCDLALFS